MHPRHHLPTVWIRGSGLAFALCWLVMAAGFWSLRTTEMYLPEFWPWWFAATGVTTALAVFLPQYEMLVRMAGAMSFVAAASRVVALYLAWHTGESPLSDGRVAIAIAAYVMLSAGLALFWLREVAPWAACERRKRG